MPRVEVRLEGLLDEQWADWLEGFSLTHCVTHGLAPGGGETLLAGEVQDQAALYGLLAKLRDLGVKLLAVNFESLAGAQEVECSQDESEASLP
jgi:hypothetical protein